MATVRLSIEAAKRLGATGTAYDKRGRRIPIGKKRQTDATARAKKAAPPARLEKVGKGVWRLDPNEIRQGETTMEERTTIFNADDETVADARARLADVDWAGLLYRYGPEEVAAFVSDQAEQWSGVPLRFGRGEVAEATRLAAVLRSLRNNGVTFGFDSDDPKERIAGIVRFAAFLGNRRLMADELEAVVEDLLGNAKKGPLPNDLEPLAAAARQILIALAEAEEPGR